MCQNSLPSGVGRSLGAKISGGRGRPWGIFFGFYKTRHILLSDSPKNSTVLRAVVSTQYRRVTDGRTDGIAIANTALAMRALRRAIKMGRWRKRGQRYRFASGWVLRCLQRRFVGVRCVRMLHAKCVGPMPTNSGRRFDHVRRTAEQHVKLTRAPVHRLTVGSSENVFHAATSDR